MSGLEFSVPYNNDPSTLEGIFALKNTNDNKIREVYLSGPQEFSAAGRIVAEINEAKFFDVVDLIHKQDIRVNLVMNPTCEGTEWYKPDAIKTKLDFLKKGHLEHNIEAVTIANPLYIKKVREQIPKIEICASVLSDIDCVQKATIFANCGANVITPDVSLHRDLAMLKKIREATKLEIKLMVNEGCLYKCPFRKFHFNYISHKSKELGSVEGDPFFFNCFQVTEKDHSQIVKSGWIRPEDVSKYKEITSFFKIVGRERPKSHVLRTVTAYMTESWDGDVLDILCSSLNHYSLETGAHLDNKSLDRYDFFEKTTSCARDCVECHYCDEIADKLIRLKVPTRGKLEDLGMHDIAEQMEKHGKLS
jgi:Collagenase and related proteases